MSFTIRGLATAVPDLVVSREESVHIAKILCGPSMTETDWVQSVYDNSGVMFRHQVIGQAVVDDLMAGTRNSGSVFLPSDDRQGPTTEQRMKIYADEAPPLALEAAREAILDAGVPAQSITHLVTVSCTGFVAPGIDIALIKKLGLSPTVQRVHVGFMGCQGAINGLRVASGFTNSNPNAVVLLVAVELCSLHYYYGGEPSKVVANALFADGAAAIVGTSGGAGWRVVDTGSCLIPDSQREMGWVIGNHGFHMTLTKQIPKLIAANLRSWLEGWLDEHHLTIENVGAWAVHPGGPRILAAVEESLCLPATALDTSRRILSENGNMSSPTVLFILNQMRRDEAEGPIVVLGFGPGLIAEVALVE